MSPAQDDAVWIEASIQRLPGVNGVELTSRELTRGYIHRIGSLNPVDFVIQINPEAGATAAETRQRAAFRTGRCADTILLETHRDSRYDADDGGVTGAGQQPGPADAPIVERLRAAGAVILGKQICPSGQTSAGLCALQRMECARRPCRCPYLLDFDPCGSRLGIGCRAAATVRRAVGTGADGSIIR